MPEDPEHKRQRKKAWDEANAERKKAYWKKWYAENKDELNARKREKQKTPEGRAYHARKAREWGRKNPEAKAASAKAHRERNIDYYRAKSKAHYAANADEEKRKAREWQVKNRERRRAYLREWSVRWREENPEKYREQTRRGNSRRHGLEIDQGYAEILLGDPCSYCGAPADTIDHITSAFTGGDGEFDNLTAACRSCNSSKRERSLLVFLAGRAWDTQLNSERSSASPGEPLAA